MHRRRGNPTRTPTPMGPVTSPPARTEHCLPGLMMRAAAEASPAPVTAPLPSAAPAPVPVAGLLLPQSVSPIAETGEPHPDSAAPAARDAIVYARRARLIRPLAQSRPTRNVSHTTKRDDCETPPTPHCWRAGRHSNVPPRLVLSHASLSPAQRNEKTVRRHQLSISGARAVAPTSCPRPVSVHASPSPIQRNETPVRCRPRRPHGDRVTDVFPLVGWRTQQHAGPGTLGGMRLLPVARKISRSP
jgi:hypothetical protein